MLSRDKMPEAARQHISELFPFVYSCYSALPILSYHDIVIQCAGVHLGDPLGLLLFCLVIDSKAQIET